jgi:hypothetical protein
LGKGTRIPEIAQEQAAELVANEWHAQVIAHIHQRAKANEEHHNDWMEMTETYSIEQNRIYSEFMLRLNYDDIDKLNRWHELEEQRATWKNEDNERKVAFHHQKKWDALAEHQLAVVEQFSKRASIQNDPDLLAQIRAEELEIRSWNGDVEATRESNQLTYGSQEEAIRQLGDYCDSPNMTPISYLQNQQSPQEPSPMTDKDGLNVWSDLESVWMSAISDGHDASASSINKNIFAPPSGRFGLLKKLMGR